MTWPKRPPPGENFMGANCNVTPQLKNFFLLQIWLDQKDPPSPLVKILWVQTVTLHLNEKIISIQLLTPDTTKTTCYRSAAQCWKAFLVCFLEKMKVLFFRLIWKWHYPTSFSLSFVMEQAPSNWKPDSVFVPKHVSITIWIVHQRTFKFSDNISLRSDKQ